MTQPADYATVSMEQALPQNQQDLIVSPTSSTPYIRGEWQLGRLLMAGESYPENAYEMFDKVISWVDSFLKTTSRRLDVELQLAYLNTSSVRGMIEIFDSLQGAFDAGRELSVVWMCDKNNSRAAEMGDEFKEDYSFEFVIRLV